MENQTIKAYVVLRAERSGKAKLLHGADNIKDARYWLSYIAEPGDAIFTTSAHPKYVGTGEPKYFAHLVGRKNMAYDEQQWRKQQVDPTAVITIQEGETSAPGPAVEPDSAPTVGKEPTSKNGGQTLSLDELQAVFSGREPKFKVVLLDAEKWIDWESALVLMVRETRVTGVDRTAKWPIRVSFDPKKDGEWIDYNPQMRFVLKKTGTEA